MQLSKHIVIAILAIALLTSSLFTMRPAQAVCAFTQGLNQLTAKASGNNLFLLWESSSGWPGKINNYTLFFKKSTDSGMTFGPTTNLYSTSKQPCSSLFSRMEIERNSKGSENVYTAWEGDGGIQFRSSTDGGNTFGKTISLGWGTFDTLFGPALIDWGGEMVADSNSVYITSVTSGEPDNGRHVLFTRSMDGGKTFDAAETFGNSSNHHQTPQLSVSGDNVYLVWSEYSDCVEFSMDNCQVKILFAKSSDRGATFANPITLAEGKAIYNRTMTSASSANCFGNAFCGLPSLPSIKAVGSNVYVSWLYNDTSLYFTNGAGDGTTFSTPVQVSETIHPVDSNVYFVSPFLNGYDNGRVQVGWYLNNGTAAAYNKPGCYVQLAESKDYGSHFNQPDRFACGKSVFTKEGTIYTVQVEPPNEHILFTVIDDNHTKSTILATNSTLYPQWLPTMAVSDSNLFVIWQNASAIIPDGVLQAPLVMRTSSDGGETFGNTKIVQEALAMPEFSISLPITISAIAAIIVIPRLRKTSP